MASAENLETLAGVYDHKGNNMKDKIAYSSSMDRFLEMFGG